MELVHPGFAHLTSYVDALERGWSPDSSRSASAEQLARIRADAAAFLASLDDRVGHGTITLRDGSEVPRLPGFVRWLWDGEFCGNIGLRWQAGTMALPPHCLGHIGYGVVPWKQRRGYASAALGLMLDEARALSLPFVEIVANVENMPSQRVIEANGGVLVERFVEPAACGGQPALRYRVSLA